MRFISDLIGHAAYSPNYYAGGGQYYNAGYGGVHGGGYGGYGGYEGHGGYGGYGMYQPQHNPELYNLAKYRGGYEKAQELLQMKKDGNKKKSIVKDAEKKAEYTPEQSAVMELFKDYFNELPKPVQIDHISNPSFALRLEIVEWDKKTKTLSFSRNAIKRVHVCSTSNQIMTEEPLDDKKVDDLLKKFQENAFTIELNCPSNPNMLNPAWGSTMCKRNLYKADHKSAKLEVKEVDDGKLVKVIVSEGLGVDHINQCQLIASPFPMKPAKKASRSNGKRASMKKA